MPPKPILEVRDLTVTFKSPDGAVHAVGGVDLVVEPGEVLGVVGESGSGKSVTMMAVMGLLPRTATITGSVKYRGTELLGLARDKLRAIRGKNIAMIFQDPMTSLNPVFTVGHQIAEAIRVHDKSVSKDDARRRSIELLDLVGIPRADRRVESYPHQFSGGMRQRAMIAMGVANNPDLLIADEPTTALDVTIQAQILEVLDTIRREKDIGIVLITHDLGVVAGTVDRVMVMYAGRVVERGLVDDVFYRSRHPYTRGLLAALPRLDDSGSTLLPIPGAPPSLIKLPPGCAFHPRCPHAQPNCRVDVPDLRPVYEVESACHYAETLGTTAEPERTLT